MNISRFVCHAGEGLTRKSANFWNQAAIASAAEREHSGAINLVGTITAICASKRLTPPAEQERIIAKAEEISPCERIYSESPASYNALECFGFIAIWTIMTCARRTLQRSIVKKLLNNYF